MRELRMSKPPQVVEMEYVDGIGGSIRGFDIEDKLKVAQDGHSVELWILGCATSWEGGNEYRVGSGICFRTR